MNSKERVLATIAHKEPDRVPIGEWGIDHDHVSRILGRHTYWRNRRDTKLAFWQGRRDKVVAGMNRDYVELINKLDYDVIPVESVSVRSEIPVESPRQVSDGVWQDNQGKEYKYCAANDSIVCMTHAQAKESLTTQERKDYERQLLNIDYSQFEVFDHIAGHFAKEKAIAFRSLNPFHPLLDPFGGDEAHQLMMTAIAPDEIRQLWDVTVEYNRRLMEYVAARGATIVMSGIDFGSTNGCIMSPTTIRELIMPVIKRVADDAIKLGMIPMFHCCGCVWDVLGDWVEAGFKGYQSIQASASMEWKKVKQLYGDRLTVWAGVQCETLINGNSQQVEKEVMKALKDLMPGGGFIFGSTNSVQFGAKTENYLQALDLVRNHGVYH